MHNQTVYCAVHVKNKYFVDNTGNHYYLSDLLLPNIKINNISKFCLT